MSTKKFIGHLKTVTKHRYYVFKNCHYAGITMRGLIHDLSKLNPIEFFEGVKYYKGTSSPIDECKKINGYSMAWLHHKGRNKHHFEYWVDHLYNGAEPIKMPYKYAIEMFCDYLGAGQAYSGKNFTYKGEMDWWTNRMVNNPNMVIHPQTKLFITYMMAECVKESLDTTLNKKKKLKYILKVKSKELYRKAELNYKK